jgi:hypothetical protein
MLDSNFFQNWCSYSYNNNLMLESDGVNTWIVYKTDYLNFNFIKFLFQENGECI